MKNKNIEKLKATLVTMLEATPIDEITATMLCQQAGVNRATFYYHYNSVQDVLTDIEAQVEREFLLFLAQSTVDSNGVPAKNFYVTFFEFVARNKNVCKLLLGSQYKSDFFNRAVEAGRSKVVTVMSTLYPNCPASKINYYYIFVSSGFLGLLNYWLNSGMHETVEEIAEVGERVSYMGVKYLM